jgi:hypothetical protein
VLAECLPSLDAFAHRVDEVKHALATRAIDPVANIEHVLLTTNEPRVARGAVVDQADEALVESVRFWNVVKSRGWYSVDHAEERTASLHGP